MTGPASPMGFSLYSFPVVWLIRRLSASSMVIVSPVLHSSLILPHNSRGYTSPIGTEFLKNILAHVSLWHRERWGWFTRWQRLPNRKWWEWATKRERDKGVSDWWFLFLFEISVIGDKEWNWKLMWKYRSGKNILVWRPWETKSFGLLSMVQYFFHFILKLIIFNGNKKKIEEL